MPESSNMYCMKYVNTTSIPQLLLGYTLTQAKISSKTALLLNLQYRISTACRWYKVCESCWNLINGKLLNKRQVNRIWWVCSQDCAISCDFPFAEVLQSSISIYSSDCSMPNMREHSSITIIQHYRDSEVIHVACLHLTSITTAHSHWMHITIVHSQIFASSHFSCVPDSSIIWLRALNAFSLDVAHGWGIEDSWKYGRPVGQQKITWYCCCMG